MGYCLITGGGDAGRYDIELDVGKAQKDSILAALATAINKNELDILQTENELADAAAEEAALSIVIEDLIAQYVVITRGEWTGTAEEAFEIITGLPKKQSDLAKLKVKNEPLRYKLRQLKFVRASMRKQAQQFNLFQPIQRKQAWCTDLTENRAAGSYVGTIEVKGQPDLVLIQPGARAWTQTDGIVRGREIMSPWQAYWNAAVLPGWQKWKPTYRWGTISSINYSNDTCSVSLAEATSSAQRLGINQDATLSNVPISYMTCNAKAFEVGDRVVVRFSWQDWAAPMVIGFVDNPKPCIEFQQVTVQMFLNTTITGGGETRMFMTEPPLEVPCGTTVAGYPRTLEDAEQLLTGPMSCTGNVYVQFGAPVFAVASPEATIDCVLPPPYFLGATNTAKCSSSDEIRPPSGGSPQRYFTIASGGVISEFTRNFADLTLDIFQLSFDPNNPCPVDGQVTVPAYVDDGTMTTLATTDNVAAWLPAIPTMSVTITTGSVSTTREYELKDITDQFNFIYGPVEE